MNIVLNKKKLFSLNKKQKKMFFEKQINLLTQHHYKKSKSYKQILDFFGYKLKNQKLNQIPFLPARLFKKFELISIPKEKISKILNSSGTTGSTPSKIYLDKTNAINQIKALSDIMTSIIGNYRLPMLIIEQNLSAKNRSIFSAKFAAIHGFSIFGRNHTYLLKGNNEIDYNLLNRFLKNFGKKPFLIFGFTNQIFIQLIKKLSSQSLKGNLKNGILLHGGGWKKMEKIKINNKIFKQKLFEKTKLKKIYNYYGLVEQTGSIFVECDKCSCFVTSIYSDVLIRDKHFNLVKDGNKGFIQLFSLLPTSYPGHSILTEDIGEIIRENNCDCINKGKRFLVHGRVFQSETRGCSDT